MEKVTTLQQQLKPKDQPSVGEFILNLIYVKRKFMLRELTVTRDEWEKLVIQTIRFCNDRSAADKSPSNLQKFLQECTNEFIPPSLKEIHFKLLIIDASIAFRLFATSMEKKQ